MPDATTDIRQTRRRARVGLPPYVQIKQSILDALATGDLISGDKLPPIRQLAGDLGVAANTVARAYRELEGDGVVVSNGRRGTRVLAHPEVDPAGEAVKAVTESIRAAKGTGLDTATILHLVTRTLAAE